jgi:lipopolysaccharide/colanic/teichoic acid biosynthesis glycosyltransferase
LRRTRLDELLQLWNVLKGDMSFIGPRPLLERDLVHLPDHGFERCSLRPGITGWAQVHGGHQLGPAEKLALDLYYIRNFTLLLDLKIAGKTVRMMMLGEKVDANEIRRAQEELALS